MNTEDEGYSIAGDVDGQFLFLKVDSSGAVQWEKTYGNGPAISIIETVDGGYALAGTGDLFNFVKTDSEGDLQWSRNFSNSGVTFRIESLIQASDGGIVLAGWTPAGSSPNWDWTVKIGSDGDVLWDRTYGVISAQSMATCVIEADDGGYVLAANSNISKLDSSGNMQ